MILCHSVSLFFTTCILGTGSFLDHLKLMENPDTQPQIKNHYRGHKLSMWLSLIPQIHSPGDSTDPMRHHHFNEENPQFYDGKRISSWLRMDRNGMVIFWQLTGKVRSQSSIRPNHIRTSVPSSTTTPKYKTEIAPLLLIPSMTTGKSTLNLTQLTMCKHIEKV